MVSHRRRAAAAAATRSRRSRGHVSAAAFEALEGRSYLTVLSEGQEFRWQQNAGTGNAAVIGQVNAGPAGPFLAEIIGAVMDEDNDPIFTDLPGTLDGKNVLGGLGGYRGADPLGTGVIDVNDARYGAGSNLFRGDAQTPGQINFRNLATNAGGVTYGLNVGQIGTAAALGRPIIQLAEISDNTGDATVRAMLQEASLREDAYNTSVTFNQVSDVAVHPVSGDIYVLDIDPAGANNEYRLTVIDRDTGDLIGARRRLLDTSGNNFGAISANVSTNNAGAMAFGPGNALYVFTADYDNKANADASGNPVAANGNANVDPALIRIDDTDPASATFGQWDGATADVRELVDQATGQEVPLDYIALAWDGPASRFRAISLEGGAGTPQSVVHTINPAGAGNPVTFTTGGAIAGPTPVGAVHGLAFAIDLDGDRILVGVNHTGAGKANLLAVDVADPATSEAISTEGSTALAFGLGSFADAKAGDTRPLLYTVASNTPAGNVNVVRGSAVHLAVTPTDGESAITAITAADFHPGVDGLLYFVSVDGKNQLLNSIDVGAADRSRIQNSLVAGTTAWVNTTITSIAFDRTSPTDAELLVLDSASSRISTGVTVTDTDTAATVAIQDDLKNDFAPAATINCAPLTGISAMEVIGRGVVSQGGSTASFVGEDVNAEDEYVFVVANSTNGNALYRIHRDTGGAMYWGGLESTNANVNADSIEAISFNPVTNQLLGVDNLSDRLFDLDARLRPENATIYQVYVAESDAKSSLSIAEYDETQNVERLVPFDGNSGDVRVNNAQDGKALIVSSNAGTGRIFIGVQTLNIDCKNPDDDLRPVVRGTLLDSIGDPQTAFGLAPTSTAAGRLDAGYFVGTDSKTNGPQDMGRLVVGGTLTGRVNVSGSQDFIYTGWNLIGDARGVGAGSRAFANDPQSTFFVGGELRNMLSLDSIGTDAALDGQMDKSTYSTGFAATIGGKLGQIDTEEDFMGTVEVRNADGASTLRNGHDAIETRRPANGVEDAIAAAFANGRIMHTAFYDDTFDTAQYVGTVTTTDASNTVLNNVISVSGITPNSPPAEARDGSDFYAFGLMAGQTIRVQGTLAIVNIYDPDGRLVASDRSDVDAAAYADQVFQVKADRPGMWRLEVRQRSLLAPYQVLIRNVGDVALGAVHAAGDVFDNRLVGPSFSVERGDLGGLVADRAIATIALPTTLLDEDKFEQLNPAAEDALVGASITVTDGNLRAIDASDVGTGVSANADGSINLDVFKGSVGLIAADNRGGTGGDMVVNRMFTYVGAVVPRVTDHDPAGVARQVAIGGDYQELVAAGNFYGWLMANRRVGAIRAGSMINPFFVSQNDTSQAGMVVVNADNAGRDGIIDLIDINGIVGRSGPNGANRLLLAGPAFITGPGGNLRYFHVRGDTYRDPYFGGFSTEPEETIFGPGEAATFRDDSGAEMKISPSGAGASVRVVSYGVRGSGGSAIVRATSTDAISIRATGTAAAAGAEIGRIEANNAVRIDGSSVVDVFMIEGGGFTTIANNSKATKAGKVVEFGELVNITAGAIGNLQAGNIGVAKQSTPSAIRGVVPRIADVYPFQQQTIGVVAGSIGTVKAFGAIGNLIVSGDVGTITADSDRRNTPGARGIRLLHPIEGIVAPIYILGSLNSAAIGEGITTTGNGLVGHSGLFVSGAIGTITGDNAQIRGDIVSETGIGRIQLRNASSIIWADIIVTDRDFSVSQEQVSFVNKFNSGSPNTINNPGYEIGSIFVDGGSGSRTRKATNGGIIGSLIAGYDVGTIRLRRTFGMLNSGIYTGRNGRLNELNTDGYGIRDTRIIGGTSIGRVIANGNGAQTKPTTFSPEVRLSERFTFDPQTKFAPNRTTDLHAYLKTTKAKPLVTDGAVTRFGVTRAGVIAGTAIAVSRDVDLVSAWRVTTSNRVPEIFAFRRGASDFDVANKIEVFQVRESIIDAQITTGQLDKLLVGKDLHSPTITVAGLFGELRIGRHYTVSAADRRDVIEAIGPDGVIGKVFIGGKMEGNIEASVRIGPHTVRGTKTGDFIVNDVVIP